MLWSVEVIKSIIWRCTRMFDRKQSDDVLCLSFEKLRFVSISSKENSKICWWYII